MLYLCLGPSGSGKTFTIKEQIKQTVEQSAYNKIVFLVPEQFSFETERAFYYGLGAEKSLQVQVLSFTRLANLIFRENGGLAGTYLNASGKAVLMNTALFEVKESLCLYERQAANPSFTMTMLGMISELKYAGIGCGRLNELSKEMDMCILKDKLQDIGLIYSAYDALLSRGWLDDEDDLERALRLVRESNFFSHYTVFVDGFKGFTYQELQMLETIITQSKDCYFAFCTESISNGNNCNDLFSPVTKVVNRLISCANKNNIKIAPPFYLNEPRRFINEDIAHLQLNLFHSTGEPYEKLSPNIQLYTAKNRYDEVTMVASQIRRLVREQQIRYKDVVVICRYLEKVQPIIETIFDKYEIPVYLDTRQPIMTRLLIRFVFSALSLITDGLNAEELLRLLKTGLLGISFEEIFQFENYIYIWNIRGQGLRNEFKNNPRGFAGKKTEEDEQILCAINATRDQVLKPLMAFKQAFEKNSDGSLTNAAQKTKALYHYITTQKICENLPAVDEKQRQDHEQTWNALMDIFDQLVYSLKNTQLDSKRYVQLLQLVCSTYDEGKIPQTLDQVTVGSADRIRTNEPVVAFILGAAEGEFPALQADYGLFSMRERDSLNKLGAEITQTGEPKWLEERFICYLALTCMSEKLFISYPINELSGKVNTESAIFKEIKRLFPAIEVKNYSDLQGTDLIETKASAFSVYAREIKNHLDDAATIKALLTEDDTSRHKIDRLSLASPNQQFSIKDPALAKALFGENMAVSPTRLEQFYICKFKYFCQYGIKAKPVQKAELSPMETGSVFHFVLEAIIGKYKGKNLANVPIDNLALEVEQLLKEYLALVMQGEEDKTERFKYLFARLKNSLVKLLVHLGREFLQSEFEPCDFELSVSFKEGIKPIVLDIASGGKIYVEGRIDRTDIFVRDGQKYVRIVDYKSGTKEFKLSDVYNGLNMQMLIYLFSIWQNGAEKYKNVLPAGVLYMPVQGTIAEVARHADESELEAVNRSAYKMNGLILNDSGIVAAMEKDISGIFIPAKLKKDMTFDSTSSVATLAQMGAIKDRVEKLIIELANELRVGNIEAVPTISGAFDPCAFCDYSSVCLNEDKERCRKLPSVSRKEMLELLEEEQKNGG